MAVIKGCEWESARVKEATLILIDHLCGAGSSSTPTTPNGTGSGHQLIPVTTNMEISPIHHSIVVGKNNINLKVGRQNRSKVNPFLKGNNLISLKLMISFEPPRITFSSRETIPAMSQQ